MESSEDRFLDGRILARQPLDGFRAGIDAVMLAAAVPASSLDELLELGSGAGIASLCVASRVPDCSICGVEIASGLVELARANACANHMEQRLSFQCADVLNPEADLRRGFDHVFCNPPFHGKNEKASPDEARARALRDDGRLGEWLAAGTNRTKAGGTFTAIIRTDRLGEVLRGLPTRGVAIFPLWPRAGDVAKRAIVQLHKNSRAPLTLHAGLVLHERDGRYTDNAEAVLRRAGSLALASPRL
ncbi:MAG: tRNA1(Val) (adenine(37)-N6)-methyltransferase [Rhizomicrobium sp.]